MFTGSFINALIVHWTKLFWIDVYIIQKQNKLRNLGKYFLVDQARRTYITAYPNMVRRLSSLKLISWNRTHYSRTSLIWTPKGQSKVSVLERCPYKRGHYDDITFMTPLTVLSHQQLKPGLDLSLNCI